MSDFYDSPDKPIESSDEPTGRNISRDIRVMVSDIIDTKALSGGLDNLNSSVLSVRESINTLGNSLTGNISDSEINNQMENQSLVNQVASITASDTEQRDLLEDIKLLALEESDNLDDSNEEMIALLNQMVDSGLDQDLIINTLEGISDSFIAQRLGDKLDLINDELFRTRLQAEADRERGGTTGGLDGLDDDEDSGGGFLSNLLPFALMRKGCLKGLLGMLKRGLRIFGPIVAGVMSIFDGFQGFQDASNITGIAEEDLTLMDKSMAALSNIISGFTFGLVDAQTVYKKGGEAIEYLKEFFVERLPIIIKDMAANLGNMVAEFASDMLESSKMIIKGLFGDKLVGTIVGWVDSVVDFIKDIFTLDNIKKFISMALPFTPLGMGKMVLDMVRGGRDEDATEDTEEKG